MVFGRFLTLLLIASLPISVLGNALASDAEVPAALAEARQVYREALEDISRGQVDSAQDKLPALQDYPQRPYLELELIKAQIGDYSSAAIDAHLTKYQDTLVGKRVRIAWLQHLLRQNDWGQFVRYYEADPPSGFTCVYIRALRKQDMDKKADLETAKLWQTPYSLPKACDGVLRQWSQRLSDEERADYYWQRAALAMRAEQFSLAAYLLGKIPGQDQYRELLQHPHRLYRVGTSLPVNEHSRMVASHTLQRLAARDFERANTLWHQLQQHLGFSDLQNHQLRDALARQIIAGDAEYVRDWINANDPEFEDPYLTEWRVRLALRDRDWKAVHRFIAALPEDRRKEPDWQYWWARADIEIHQEFTPHAQRVLRQMATERGYYSFMAADLLNQEYRLGDRRTLNPALIPQVQQNPAVQRAIELQWHGESLASRLEWNQALNGFSRDEQVAAAQLAMDLGWVNQAIMTAIRADEWDDLTLRFPVAYKDNFDRAVSAENLDLKWVYAIARQESAFNPSARSPVGARGLMQLMPATARSLARQMGDRGFHYRDLTNPDTNIAMGSFYLAKLMERFGGNRILATAAYNAGPHRVERVLERQSSDIPADIWIENLPYTETRHYIKNVLAFSVVYGEKLAVSRPILAQHEREISPLLLDEDAE